MPANTVSASKGNPEFGDFDSVQVDFLKMIYAGKSVRHSDGFLANLEPQAFTLTNRVIPQHYRQIFRAFSKKSMDNVLITTLRYIGIQPAEFSLEDVLQIKIARLLSYNESTPRDYLTPELERTLTIYLKKVAVRAFAGMASNRPSFSAEDRDAAIDYLLSHSSHDVVHTTILSPQKTETYRAIIKLIKKTDPLRLMSRDERQGVKSMLKEDMIIHKID